MAAARTHAHVCSNTDANSACMWDMVLYESLRTPWCVCCGAAQIEYWKRVCTVHLSALTAYQIGQIEGNNIDGTAIGPLLYHQCLLSSI